MAQTVNVVHVITGLKTGGAETMLYRLLSHIDRERFSCAVVSLMDQGTFGIQLQRLGIPVYSLGVRSWYPSLRVFLRLLRSVRSLKPDIIQGWMYHGNLAATLSSRFLGNVPLIWNVRHTPHGLSGKRRRTGFMLRLSAALSHRSEKIIYNAHTSALQHEALGYRKEKRLVIPNGFDTQQFQPSERSRHEVRDELGLPASTSLVGLIARYHPLKGHPTFLRAAALLLVDHPEVHFLLVGRDVDGSNVTLWEQICNCGMQGWVHLLGERTDISRVMSALDVATSSSYSEGFSNVIGEAMACGIPCVVTDVGDSAFLVGDTGLIVPPGDEAALCEGWKKLLDMDPEDRRVLGDNAQARVQKMFGLDAIVSQYENLYEEVLLR